jgi:hypothetical protein
MKEGENEGKRGHNHKSPVAVLKRMSILIKGVLRDLDIKSRDKCCIPEDHRNV